jgi:enamine deaminase RidA (YjgF/YER057c/UK114 family)/catechol 2,3-dioxygenase-like lactoylglutathione lyase family enzyme
MTLTADEKLLELGITLPPPPAAVAAYEPWVRVGNLVITSGQLPWREGKLAYTGKLGTDLTVEQGYQAARLCAINALAQLKAAAGDLQRIRRVLRLEGYVHAGPGFFEHPLVLNGASELVNAVFAEHGRHARTALGINEMPLNAAVQLGVWAEVEAEELDRAVGISGTSIAHITLATRDVVRSRDFFAGALGWRPIARPNNIGRPAAWLEIAPGQELHLVHLADFAPSPFEQEFGRHIALNYRAPAFAALKTRLLAHGAELIAAERPTPFERFFFRSPDGYVFEVVAVERSPEVGEG